MFNGGNAGIMDLEVDLKIRTSDLGDHGAETSDLICHSDRLGRGCAFDTVSFIIHNEPFELKYMLSDDGRQECRCRREEISRRETPFRLKKPRSVDTKQGRLSR